MSGCLLRNSSFGNQLTQTHRTDIPTFEDISYLSSAGKCTIGGSGLEARFLPNLGFMQANFGSSRQKIESSHSATFRVPPPGQIYRKINLIHQTIVAARSFTSKQNEGAAAAPGALHLACMWYVWLPVSVSLLCCIVTE